MRRQWLSAHCGRIRAADKQKKRAVKVNKLILEAYIVL